MSATIRVNGEFRAVAATVAALLAELGIDRGARGLAVAVNGAVVRRPAWDDAPLVAGDAVEIIRPLTGG